MTKYTQFLRRTRRFLRHSILQTTFLKQFNDESSSEQLSNVAVSTTPTHEMERRREFQAHQPHQDGKDEGKQGSNRHHNGTDCVTEEQTTLNTLIN